MRLVLIDKEDIDIMQTYVRKVFKDTELIDKGEESSKNLSKTVNSTIDSRAETSLNLDFPNNNQLKKTKSKEIPITFKTSDVFTSDTLSSAIWYRKMSGGESLDIVFYTRELISIYKYKLYDYVDYVLNYSGKNSLVHYLKSNGFITSMTTGLSDAFSTYSTYIVSFDLTQKGYLYLEKVIKKVFGYINQLKAHPLKQDWYNEIAKITINKFKCEFNLVSLKKVMI